MDSCADFAALALRFEALGKKDREAVLAEFSAEDRRLIEQALTDQLQASLEEADRRRRTDRQFQAYSPWLADTRRSIREMVGFIIKPFRIEGFRKDIQNLPIGDNVRQIQDTIYRQRMM